jgi:methyl-accepting chemotaxis protein
MQSQLSVRRNVFMGVAFAVVLMAAVAGAFMATNTTTGVNLLPWYGMLAGAAVIGLIVALIIGARIERPVRALLTQLEALEKGDLSEEHAMNGAAQGELGSSLQHVLQMRTKMRQLVQQARQSAQEAADAAHTLAGMTEQVSSSVQQQADSTREAAATIQQMTVSINQVANSSGKASRMARESGETASERVQDVLQASEQMRILADKVQATSQRIEALTGQVEKIGNIVGVIVSVADQTNLLALNAAIEAARAGEAGRGFAVVADEVRKLAERSAVSAQEITLMISTIQRETGTVVESMQESLESVLTVSQGAAQSAESIQGIQQSSQSVVSSIESISGTLREQRMASIELAQKVDTAAKMAEANIGMVDQLRSTSAGLLQLSSQLKQRADEFSPG